MVSGADQMVRRISRNQSGQVEETGVSFDFFELSQSCLVGFGISGAQTLWVGTRQRIGCIGGGVAAFLIVQEMIAISLIVADLVGLLEPIFGSRQASRQMDLMSLLS